MAAVVRIAPPSAAAEALTFAHVFDAEFDYVNASLRRLGVSARDVEDVAHEVFIHVHQKFATFDATRPIRPWLFGFCFRTASDYRRLARHRREWIGEAAEPRDPQPLADEAVARQEDATLITRALETIDLDRRAVLVAYELDEIPMKELAENLGIPLQTAYSRLRVAREEFAAAVRRLRLIEGTHAQR